MAVQSVVKRFVRWTSRMGGRLSLPVEERIHRYPQFDPVAAIPRADRSRTRRVVEEVNPRRFAIDVADETSGMAERFLSIRAVALVRHRPLLAIMTLLYLYDVAILVLSDSKKEG